MAKKHDDNPPVEGLRERLDNLYKAVKGLKPEHARRLFQCAHILFDLDNDGKEAI